MDVANVDMAAAWDGPEGDSWTEHADGYERAGRHVMRRFFDADLIRTADRVLDVGCGTGGASRDVARIAREGSVLGLDLSSRMLEEARKRSADDGLTNVEFVQGDAQVHPFTPASFDLAMSSFGVMFFSDPVAAFTNIGAGVRSGGRLALLAWRELESNEWLMALRGALAMGRDLPVPPPTAPTPFSLADPDRVRSVLGAAGFADVELTAIDEGADMGATADDAFAFVSTLGIVHGLTQELDADQRAQALDNLRDVLAAHETADGVLLNSAAWLITAVRP